MRHDMDTRVNPQNQAYALAELLRLEKWIIKRADIRHRSMWKCTPQELRSHQPYAQGYIDGLKHCLEFVRLIQTQKPRREDGK